MQGFLDPQFGGSPHNGNLPVCVISEVVVSSNSVRYVFLIRLKCLFANLQAFVFLPEYFIRFTIIY